MKPFTKICGITNSADALTAAELGADALGFIFYEKSPRNISVGSAAKIISQLPDDIDTVGVFVNQSHDLIEEIIDRTGIRTIQLHGDEPPEECIFNDIRVWKAIRPMNNDIHSLFDGYKVDAYLLDTYNRTLYGGTGKTGNWQVAGEAAKFYQIILSGGLNPDNILNAITTVKPFGIDVNSGVETEPGKKDHNKLKSLFKILNNQ